MEKSFYDHDAKSFDMDPEYKPYDRLAKAIQMAKDLDLLDRSPYVRVLLSAIAQEPENPEPWYYFQEYIRPYCFHNQVEPTVFKIPPPGVLKGDVYLGRAEDGSTVFVESDDWVRGAFVGGNIGSGKTSFLGSIAFQLINRGKVVWWYDTQKMDGLYLARAIKEMLYFKVGDNFRYNPFQTNRVRTDPKSKAISVIEIFSRENHLLEGSKDYLLDKVFETIEAHNPDPITFQDLLYTIENDRRRTHRNLMYNDTCRNRIRAWIHGLGRTIECRRGFDIIKLMQQSHVLDTVGLPVEIQSTLIGLLIDDAAKTLMALGQVTNKLKIALFIDECNNLMPRNQDFNSVETPSTLQTHSRIIREFGLGICAATQNPSSVSEASVRTQSHFKMIIGSLGSHTDYDQMADIMNFNEDQLAWAKSHAKIGQGIVKLATGPFRDPFIIDIPYFNLKRI